MRDRCNALEITPMTLAAQASSPARPSASSTILLAGLGGGAIDFVYASGMAMAHGRPFIRVWQGVASGWLGDAAASGGLASMALGIATHFGIAICMAAAYALVAARLPLLYRRPVACGLAYGVVLYLVMYRIVMPLRWGAALPWNGLRSVADIASHIGVALVIAVVLSRRATARR
jgi:hypothetical protein